MVHISSPSYDFWIVGEPNSKLVKRLSRVPRSDFWRSAVDTLTPLFAITSTMLLFVGSWNVFGQGTVHGFALAVIVTGIGSFFIFRTCFRFACKDIDASDLRHSAAQGVRADIYSERELAFQALNPTGLPEEVRTTHKETIDVYFKQSRPTYQPYRTYPVDTDTWTLDKYERDLATIERAAMLLDVFGVSTDHLGELRQVVIHRANLALETLQERQDQDAALTEEIRQAILRQQNDQN